MNVLFLASHSALARAVSALLHASSALSASTILYQLGCFIWAEPPWGVPFVPRWILFALPKTLPGAFPKPSPLIVLDRAHPCPEPPVPDQATSIVLVDALSAPEPAQRGECPAPSPAALLWARTRSAGATSLSAGRHSCESSREAPLVLFLLVCRPVRLTCQMVTEKAPIAPRLSSFSNSSLVAPSPHSPPCFLLLADRELVAF